MTFPHERLACFQKPVWHLTLLVGLSVGLIPTLSQTARGQAAPAKPAATKPAATKPAANKPEAAVKQDEAAEASDSKKPGKRRLEHTDYDHWNRISGTQLSEDGAWVLYTVSPGEGDSTTYIRQLNTRKQYLFRRGTRARFSQDSQFVVLMLEPDPKQVEQLKKAKKKPEELPKSQLVVLNLQTGEQTAIQRVRSFQLPEDAAGWVAYQLEKPLKDEQTGQQESSAGKSTAESTEQPAAAAEPEKPSEQKSEKPPAAGEQAETEAKKKPAKKKDPGTELVLRELETGEETRYPNVTSYLFSPDGKRLFWSASGTKPEEDGVFVLQTRNRKPRQILEGLGNYRSLTVDESGKRLALVTDRDDYAAKDSAHSVYLWQQGDKQAERVISADTPGLPKGWWVPDSAQPSFSKSGQRLFVSTRPRPPAEKQEAEKQDGKGESEKDEEPDPDADEKPVVVDIWHWKDPLLQPMQLLRANATRNRTYRAVFHIEEEKFVQLGHPQVPNISTGDTGDTDYVVGTSNVPYEMEISWDSPRFNDVYLVDVRSGQRRRVLRGIQSFARLSPGGKYLTWFDVKKLAWFALSTSDRKVSNLSELIPHPVHDELHDQPSPPSAYGDAGWLEEDAAVLLYDKHDIWAVDPAGTLPPVCVTDGVGREENLRFRYVNLDRERDSIPANSPLLLSAFHLHTKASGYYRDQVRSTAKPTQLVMRNEAVRVLEKAEGAETVLLTRSTFEMFPDLWTTDLSFQEMQRVSDANPQQAEYSWGSAELVEWTSLDGEPLQGILYKPDGFDPAQKYPMMVYFYERNSNNLHRYYAPGPSRASINYSFYVSRGYLLFVPDIPYKIGHPGQSCLNAVLPGVTSLINQGFVNPKKVGVQGHSWGGYQIAYLITRCDLFAAAESGAPVSNMTSAYGGIRWSSGMSRMFQYEKTQSRIGGTLWDAQQKYIENSPVFWADQVRTPVLILHNDKDGAVPWYQGIEFFVALRRLARPAWMVNYNGEDHGLRKEENQKDWAIRMQQFFDHYLLDAPAPVWLRDGVPATEKGKTLGLELTQ